MKNVAKTPTVLEVPWGWKGAILFDDDRTVTAYHEAGHALLAEWYGARVVFVSSIPTDHESIRSHGETRAVWGRSSMNSREKHAILQARVALGGPVAELIYTDEQYEPRILSEWRYDLLAAREAISTVLPARSNDQDADEVIRPLFRDLLEFFSRDQVWDRVATVAVELEAHECLEEEMLAELRAAGLFTKPMGLNA